jgi:hypothetical protein
VSGGKVRLVRCPRGEVGIVVGPYAEADYNRPSVMDANGIMVKPIPTHLEQESVAWWSPTSRRWREPVAAWTLELETIPVTHKGALGKIIADIETKLRADKGLRVGTDNSDRGSTWYAVNSALGI